MITLVIILYIFLAIFVILVVSIFVFIGLHAHQMGYSGFLWFIVSILITPLVALCLLVALPNRSIEKKRNEERELLEKQLEQRKIPDEKKSSVVPRKTISDDVTIR